MYLSTTQQALLPFLGQYGPLIIVSSFIAFFAYNYFQKGLYKVPGPFLAGLTNWYRIYYVLVGRRQDIHQNRMHEKYGDVVRYGPNLVSFANPQAINDIYGIGKPISKSPYYLPSQAMSKGRAFPSLFTLLENKAHSDLKRTLATAFSGSSIVSLEPLVDPVIDAWVKQTKKIYVEGNRVCDIGWWMQLFAFDVVTNLTYSKTHGMVEQHQDVDGIVAWLGWMFSYTSVVGQMPILDQFLNKNPIQRFLEWAEISVPTFPTVIFAKKRIEERLSTDPSVLPTKQGMRPDILTQLMESGKKHPNVLTMKMITSQAVSIAFAGSDNTAVTLTAIIYYLLKNRRCYERLMTELDDAAANGRIPANPGEILTWEQSQGLTYFNAVVKESQRLYPSVGGLLERMTPPQGAVIQGKWYPGNTLVGCNAWVIHQRKEVFGDDCAEFKPERWIEGDPDHIKTMNQSFFAFGAGTRACIGRSISLLEIGKAVPVWLRLFDIKLVDPEKEWTVHNSFVVKQHGVNATFSMRKYLEKEKLAMS